MRDKLFAVWGNLKLAFLSLFRYRRGWMLPSLSVALPVKPLRGTVRFAAGAAMCLLASWASEWVLQPGMPLSSSEQSSSILNFYFCQQALHTTSGTRGRLKSPFSVLNLAGSKIPTLGKGQGIVEASLEPWKGEGQEARRQTGHRARQESSVHGHTTNTARSFSHCACAHMPGTHVWIHTDKQGLQGKHAACSCQVPAEPLLQVLPRARLQK